MILSLTMLFALQSSTTRTDVVVPLPVPFPAGAVASGAVELVPSRAGALDRDAGAGFVPERDGSSPPVRIADMVEIDGVRDNQLIGSGIVVGLAGTGDRGNATRRAVANFVRRTELNIDPTEINAGNVALVSVTARLGRFPAPGTQVDVHVQSVGDAESLFGGFLLQAPLRAGDGRVYVVAQGPVNIGGFTARGEAARLTRNHALVGIVADGGIVERGVEMHMVQHGHMHLHLRAPNYLTASRVAGRLNEMFPGAARAMNHRTIRLRVPEKWQQDPVGFYSNFGVQTVIPGEEAVLVINERTGTLVAGHNVRISTSTITHSNLTISIAESPVASQPLPFSEGETVVQPRTDVSAEVESRGLSVVSGGTSATELAEGLNRLGVSPRDLVSIFLALKKAGHLHARIEVM